MGKYRLVSPISAILDIRGDTVTLPAGAVLSESQPHSTTLLGMVGVLWNGRHYSVYPRDLLEKAEPSPATKHPTKAGA